MFCLHVLYFLAFLLYSLQVALAFGILSSLYGDFMKAVGASVRIFDLMDRKPTVGTEENLNIPEAFDSSKFNYINIIICRMLY